MLRMTGLTFVLAAVGTIGTACTQGPTKVTSEAAKALAIAIGDAALQWGPCPSIMPAGCEIAVLHGDPAKPNADIFLRVPSGSQIPAHSHTSAERMVAVSGDLDVTYQGQPPVRLAVGNYAYGPAGLAHKATCVSTDPCTLFIAFETPIDAKAYEGAF